MGWTFLFPRSTLGPPQFPFQALPASLGPQRDGLGEQGREGGETTCPGILEIWNLVLERDEVMSVTTLPRRCDAHSHTLFRLSLQASQACFSLWLHAPPPHANPVVKL